MDKISLLIIITGISLFISLFLAFFLITLKSKHKLSNFLFALFLVLTAIDSSSPLFNLITNQPSNLGMLRNTFAFLQIPVFYLYILSVCYSDFKLKPKYLLHLLPFLIANLILLPRFYTVDINSKIDFIINRQSSIELQFTHILFHAQTIIYIFGIFVLLNKAKKLYLENYADASIKSYNWLFQFTIVLTILYLIVLIKNIFKFSDYPIISEGIKIGVISFQLLIVCWYLFKALNNPDLFRNIDSKLRLAKDIAQDRDKDGNNNIVLEETPKDKELKQQSVESQKEYYADLSKLKKYMIEHKPFLNPSLTIQDVSAATQIPVRELSILINHKLEKHFYDFINEYRIESAMKILKDSTKSKVTILEILYQVGFNSKSSFNTAFKKYTGKTPTSYRKSL